MKLPGTPPLLEGTLLVDDASREQFAVDLALNVRRVPLAVLQPGSVQDVVRIVQYANRQQIKVALRGQGHSRYGQTLAEAGIVIDSSTLRSVQLCGPGSVDARGGAFWGDVTELTLPQDLTPPVLGTCLKLSVGGILSVGGYGSTAHRYGGIVDTVQELDVVTGSGELVRCSPQLERELFEMVLAGMGQIGFIARARLTLVPAPAQVVRQDLYYDQLDAFLADAQRLALEARFDHLNARATQRSDGAWIFSINVGRFYRPPQEPGWTLVPDEGMNYRFRSEPMRASFVDYLHRETGKNTIEKAGRERNPRREPSVTMFVPASDAKDFIAEVLASPASLAGLADFQFNPFSVRRLTRPLFKFPDEDVAFGVWLYPRNVALEDDASFAAALEANRHLLARMRAIGGKAYPPYAPYSSPKEWAEHYGPETWRRLTAAKQRYDPNHVLGPSLGMFPSA
jgi:FAD/FMN-containing dehydrogenase